MSAHEERPESGVVFPESEQQLYEQFKEEFLFVFTAEIWQDTLSEEFVFPVIVAMLQVPELKRRLAKWFGRKPTMIHEGRHVARVRQSLIQQVTPVSSLGEGNDHWYAFHLANSHFDEFDQLFSILTGPWLRTGDFQLYIEVFITQNWDASPNLREWVTENSKPWDLPAFFEMRKRLRDRMLSEVKGQSEAISNLCPGFGVSFLREEGCPRGIFTMLGPSDANKGHFAEIFAAAILDAEKEYYQVLKFNLGQLHKDAYSTLFGSGASAAESSLGLLTDAVRNVPNSVIFIADIDKARPDVIQGLLRILDTGIATDETSQRRVDFSRAFFFFSTSLGQKFLHGWIESDQDPDDLDFFRDLTVLHSLKRTERNPDGLLPKFVNHLVDGHCLVFEEQTALS